MKRRHLAAVDLGAVPGVGVSEEVDLSSMDSAILFITTASSLGACTFRIEAAPEDFGETPTWRTMGVRHRTVDPLSSVAIPVGQHVSVSVGYSDAWITGSTFCPRRIRVKHVSGALITDCLVEGVRSIA